MVATVRCEEIANEKLNRLRSDKVLIISSLLSVALVILRINHHMSEFGLGLVGIGGSY